MDEKIRKTFPCNFLIMNYLLPNCPINVDLLLSYNLKSDVADKKNGRKRGKRQLKYILIKDDDIHMNHMQGSVLR